MKKSKNIYDFLNDMDFDIDDYEKEELNDMEKKKLKNEFRKNNKKKFNFKKFGSIAVALLLTVGILSQTGFGRDVYAMAESKLSEITYTIGNALNIERDIEKYSNVINKTVENNGVEVKLTDVIIDKDEILFSTVINTSEPADGVDFDYDIFINGEKTRLSGATGSSGKIDDSKELFSTNYEVDVKDINIKEDLDIKIVLKNFSYYTFGENNGYEDLNKIRGKWDFEFNASGSELTANTYSLPMDYSFKAGNQEYKLEEFRYNPVSQKIYGKLGERSNLDYTVDLKGFDDLGNEVEFILSRQDNENIIFRYSNIYGDLSEKAQTLTLIPYAAEIPKESGEMPNSHKAVGEKFTINLK